MNNAKTKIRRLKFRLNHDFFTLENVVFLVALTFCFVWTFQSIEAMTRNWELSEKMTAEKKSLELLRVEVETAELENEYLRSDEYQELLARKLLDKKVEGENMVIMPENSDVALGKYNSDIVAEAVKKEYSNFEKWTKFLFPKY